MFPLQGSKLYGEARVVLPGAPVDVSMLPAKPDETPEPAELEDTNDVA